MSSQCPPPPLLSVDVLYSLKYINCIFLNLGGLGIITLILGYKIVLDDVITYFSGAFGSCVNDYFFMGVNFTYGEMQRSCVDILKSFDKCMYPC